MELSVGGIARLVRDLVEADELERGTLALQPERFDLSELAQQVVEMAQEAYPRHRFPLSARQTSVVADRERIGEVIRSLLDHAVKYQPGGGEIEVTVGVEVGHAVVTVRSHGAVIPPERRPHVFEPMYEPIPAGTVGYVGVVGLGLAISKWIVELHRGRIWLESGEDRESTFHFSLPMAEGGNGRQG